MLSQMRLAEDERYTVYKPLAPPPPVMPRYDGYAMLPPLRSPGPAYSSHAPVVLRPPPPPPTPAVQATSPSSHKCSLSFILSDAAAPVSDEDSDASSMQNEPRDRPQQQLKHKRRADPATAAGSKSKYCTTEGCTSRAKHARKCWRHGGSVKCKVADCINRAKSRGVCWSHGGGTTCSHTNCGTIAVSHGFCWAHGGGKRCQVGGCSRPAYERTQNLCATHFKQDKAAKSSASAAGHTH